MNIRAVLFSIALGTIPVAPSVLAQDIPANVSEGGDNAVVEEMASKGNMEGKVPVLEEGEGDGVTERGIRRFKFKKKPRKRITIPQNPRRRIQIPQTKQPSNLPPTGNTQAPFVEDGGGQGQPVPPPGPQCVVKTSDIVHDLHIDIGDNHGAGESAKQSLLRMLSRGNLEQRRAASGMVQAIKAQSLAGIFQWNKQAVSIRSQTLTPPRGPWDLIPKGQLSMCLNEPAGEPPMIIYSRQLMDPSVLDQALVTAWGQCGLPALPFPCAYQKNMENKDTSSLTTQSDGEFNQSPHTEMPAQPCPSMGGGFPTQPPPPMGRFPPQSSPCPGQSPPVMGGPGQSSPVMGGEPPQSSPSTQ
jgi:hypothetical protein